MVSCCFLSLMSFLSLAAILKTIEALFTDAMRLTFDTPRRPQGTHFPCSALCCRSPFHPDQDEERQVIRKLKTGQYRLYSRKKDPRTGRRRNLGTFATRAAAEKHERAVQFFKRGG